MEKDWKYIFYLSILAALLLFVVLGKDKQYNWQMTYAHEDKNPFGAYALNELIPAVLQEPVQHRYKTFYELKDSVAATDNLLVISGSFNPDKDDAIALMQHVEKGGSAFIAANYMNGTLADTLGLRTYDYFFEGPNPFRGERNDTATLKLVNPKLDTITSFYFKRDNIHNFLGKADTAFIEGPPAPAEVIARNDMGKAIAIKIRHGKGYFIFCSTPMVFTNIYLLNKKNHLLTSSLLSYLPSGKTYWTEFYHLGRMEAATPLRFILTHEPLSWAYYISILSLLIFLIFESKRTQRIIPVIKPLSNSSLDFIGTISRLFYEKGDHKAIATKKILYFLDQVRSRFYLSQPHTTDGFAKMLSHKAGAQEKTCEQLIQRIHLIQTRVKISKEDLLQLNESIQTFWDEVKK
jgi:AraC-like DNA-binding protein